MNAVFDRSDKVAVLELVGRFDAHLTPRVTQWLADRTGPQQPYAVIDLGEVNFVDSTALAALVQGMKRCRGWGGDLFICAMQQKVRVIFELTRLDRAFQLYEDRATAASACSGGSV